MSFTDDHTPIYAFDPLYHHLRDDLSNRLKALLDLHLFGYEHQVYGRYEPIEPTDAARHFPRIWRWLSAACGKSHGVRRCLLFAWPPEGETTGGIVAWTDRRVRGRLRHGGILEVRGNLWDTFNAVVTHRQPSDPTIPPGLGMPQADKLLVCYFLYRAKGTPRTIDEFLDNRVFELNPDSPYEIELNEIPGTDANRYGLATLADKHPPERKGQRYYQRLAIVFCGNKYEWRELRNLSQQVVRGWVRSWGEIAELRKAAARNKLHGSVNQTRAVTHELGQVTHFLTPTTRQTSTVEPHWVWGWDTFQDWLKTIPEDERPEVLKNALVCPHRDLFEAVVDYVQLWSEAKAIRTRFDDWTVLPLAEILPRAIDWALNAGFVLEARRFLESSFDRRAVQSKRSAYFAARTPLTVLHPPGLRFRPSKEGRPLLEHTQRLRRFLMLLTAALLNAIKNTPLATAAFRREYPLAVEVGPERILIASGAIGPVGEVLNQDGSSLVLAMLKELINEGSDVKLDVRMGGLRDVPLSEPLLERLGEGPMMKTLIRFTHDSLFQ